uniref:Uncharacterized protein n=1 Tax=Romanomermis culicivorax TaxID=13658 RepID=A0A915KB30_ROMCU
MQNLPGYFQPGRRNGGRRSNVQKRLTYVNRAQILMNDPNISPRRFSYSSGQMYEVAGSSNGRQNEKTFGLDFQSENDGIE